MGVMDPHPIIWLGRQMVGLYRYLKHDFYHMVQSWFGRGVNVVEIEPNDEVSLIVGVIEGDIEHGKYRTMSLGEKFRFVVWAHEMLPGHEWVPDLEESERPWRDSFLCKTVEEIESEIDKF